MSCGRCDQPSDFLPLFQDVRMEQGKRFALGFMGGAFASCFNCPFDVAKSRIQAQSVSKVKNCTKGVGKNVIYRGTLQTIAIVYKQEGYGFAILRILSE